MNPVLLFFAVLAGWVGPQDETRVFTHGQETQLVAADKESVTLTVAGETRVLPLEQVNRIRFAGQLQALPDAARVRLSGGSEVLAGRYTMVENEAMIQESVDSASRHVVEKRNIDFVELVRHTGDAGSRWDEIANAREGTADLLVFSRQEMLDYVEGSIGNVSDETVRFTSGERTADAPRERVHGLVYYHASGRQFVDPIGYVTTAAGSRLLLRSATREDRYVVLQTVCGATFRLLPEELVDMDFASVRSTFLSSLPPSTVEWQPLIFNEKIYQYQAALNRPRFNRAFGDRVLELDFPENGANGASSRKQQFENGIAVRGGTRLVFPLAGRYTRLEGYFGFAPEASRDGRVEVVFLGDGKELFRTVMNHQTDPPQALEISVAGIGRLTLQVNYHDGRSTGDLIHFCNLKVTR